MRISVEISMYPLKDEYIPGIQAFIDRLNKYPELKVITNTMSTQVFGGLRFANGCNQVRNAQIL